MTTALWSENYGFWIHHCWKGGYKTKLNDIGPFFAISSAEFWKRSELPTLKMPTSQQLNAFSKGA